MEDTHVVVIGAGPHGLAAAAHLRRAGVECRVLGDPMSFWSTMPRGHAAALERDRDRHRRVRRPAVAGRLPCAHRPGASRCPSRSRTSSTTGCWVQRQVAPDVDRRRVDGRASDGGRVPAAAGRRDRAAAPAASWSPAGIADFVHLPAVARGLPPDLVSHTSAAPRPERLRAAGRVLVVGLGQSALESAALMHEAGAEVEVVGRRDHINWLHGGKYHRQLGPARRRCSTPPPTSARWACRGWSRPRTSSAGCRARCRTRWPTARSGRRPPPGWGRGSQGVPDHHGPRGRVGPRRRATGSRSGSTTARRRTVDHVLFGTGYRVDVARYPFLDADLAARRRDGRVATRCCGRGWSRRCPGLHFLGAPAAWSFGPTMRFVAGGWFGGASLARALAGDAAPRPRSDVHVGVRR